MHMTASQRKRLQFERDDDRLNNTIAAILVVLLVGTGIALMIANAHAA